MIGIDGAAARTRRATRWVKSGLSMMTSASGRAATTAAEVWRRWRRIAGSRPGIAAISGAPSRSPDSSPAMMNMFKGSHAAGDSDDDDDDDDGIGPITPP